MNFIPIYIPFEAKNQKKYLLNCIDTNFYSWRGKYVEECEKAIADYLGVNHFLLTFNGSVSLVLALAALDLGCLTNKKEKIIATNNLTYAATVLSINNVGATPFALDCTSDLQIDLNQVRNLLSTNSIDALLVAELYGDSPDIVALKQMCKESNTLLIEDSAEVFGCEFTKGKKLGTFGDVSSFSFFPNKVIGSAGEGGGLATNNTELYNKMQLMRGQGWLGNGFEHQGPIAFNFRPTNLQAAVLLAQLEEIEYIIEKKQYIANRYREELHPSITKLIPKIYKSSEWLPVFMLPDKINFSEFQLNLKQSGIDTRPVFTPMSLLNNILPSERKWNLTLKKSETIYKKGFNLPAYPDLTDKELTYIISTVNTVIEKN